MPNRPAMADTGTLTVCQAESEIKRLIGPELIFSIAPQGKAPVPSSQASGLSETSSAIVSLYSSCRRFAPAPCARYRFSALSPNPIPPPEMRVVQRSSRFPCCWTSDKQITNAVPVFRHHKQLGCLVKTSNPTTLYSCIPSVYSHVGLKRYRLRLRRSLGPQRRS